MEIRRINQLKDRWNKGGEVEDGNGLGGD